MRVLLTGASGLLGGEVLRQLLAAGDDVICVGRTRPAAKAAFVAIDLAAPLSGQLDLLPDSADAVIHLAQSPKYRSYPEGAADVFAVNVSAQAALLDWAHNRGASSFVHASTGGLYPGGASEPVTERTPTRIDGPLAYYLASKRSAELVGAGYEEGVSVAALRYFFIYGVGQRPHMLMPRLIENVRVGKALTLQGADGMLFNPVHVSDAAAATIAAARKRANGVFNVAGPETLSLRAVGEKIGGFVGKAPVFERTDGAPGHLVADTSHMRGALHVPTVSLHEGLAEMCR